MTRVWFALAFLLLAASASAADDKAPLFVDPYDLPDAPRPPTLPELTHKDAEVTGESTFGVLYPNTPNTPNGVAYVQRFSLEWPIALRRFFVGATYEYAAAEPPGGGPFKFISGNLQVSGRTVWATSTGLAFGGGLGVTVPTLINPSNAAVGASSAAATLRPWDQDLFSPGFVTLNPFVDVRDVDGPLVLQLREGLDFQFDTHAASDYRIAAITAAYVGYRIGRWVGAGFEAFEVYFLSGSSVADDKRAVFALSPNVRVMTPYVQPALSFVTNAGIPLFGSVDAWWAIRLAATFVWDPARKVLEPGQDAQPRLSE
jgi:hypothetical protein